MILALDKIVADSFTGHGVKKHSLLDELTLSRIRLMTGTLRLYCAQKDGLMKASESAAIFVGRGVWAARQARLWIREFKRSGKLPLNIQGAWNASIIEDEDLAAAIREHLRCIGKYAGPCDVIEFFHTPAASEFSHLLDAPPCLRTAQRWMHNMGYSEVY